MHDINRNIRNQTKFLGYSLDPFLHPFPTAHFLFKTHTLTQLSLGKSQN